MFYFTHTLAPLLYFGKTDGKSKKEEDKLSLCIMNLWQIYLHLSSFPLTSVKIKHLKLPYLSHLNGFSNSSGDEHHCRTQKCT